MKAIRVSSFGGPEMLKCVKGITIPAPSGGQVVVAVKAAGLNPVDTYIRSGTYSRKPTLPYTPCGDGAGVVHTVGDDVSTVKPGDRVWFWSSLSGSCAEYSLCSASRVAPLSSTLSFEQGASIGAPYLTAHRALFLTCRVSAGDHVLVHGASGGVGVAACQLAMGAGATVYATAGSSEGVAMLTQLGCKHVYNHKQDAYVSALKAANSGQGFTCILEMLANVNLSVDLDLVATGGRIAVIGNRGEITINPRSLMAKESSITGVMLFNSTEDDFKAAIFDLQEAMRAGHLQPIVARSYALEEAAEAHTDILTNSGAKGKLVFKL